MAEPQPTVELTAAEARRLAVYQQRLTGPVPQANERGVLDLIRQLGCVQIDPIRVVERSPLLVLWSRLGPFDPNVLHRLLFEDRALFEGWAHAASIVHAEHLPIHRWRMRRFAEGDSVGDERVRRWLEANADARREIRRQLSGAEAKRPDELNVSPVEHWRSTGWTDGRNLTMLLDLMWRKGEVTVGARDGLRKLYVDAAEWFGWDPEPRITEVEAERRAIKIAARALGVATPRHIDDHFTRGGYPNLGSVLDELVEAGELVPARVNRDSGEELAGPWYLSSQALEALKQLRNERLQGSTTLLSPFDNLIADRDRTLQLWDFAYKAEIYVPKDKRIYGHYVMPILHGSELVGRVDPKLERESKTLRINGVYFEPGWGDDRELRKGLQNAAESLAQFLGAERVEWPEGKLG